jgi:hypothetical protein
METNLITAKKLARRWGIKPSTLSQWSWNGKGPKYLKLGGRILYRIMDIASFEEMQLRKNTTGGARNLCMGLLPLNLESRTDLLCSFVCQNNDPAALTSHVDVFLIGNGLRTEKVLVSRRSDIHNPAKRQNKNRKKHQPASFHKTNQRLQLCSPILARWICEGQKDDDLMGVKILSYLILFFSLYQNYTIYQIKRRIYEN